MDQINQEARKVGFLIFGEYNTPVLYMRQLTRNIGLFIEKEKDDRYICYRLKWEFEPSDGIRRVKEEKFYCRGNLRRCLNKAKSIVDFWETKVLKNKKVVNK